MNKIDKFLSGGFAGVAFARLIAMLGFVLSSANASGRSKKRVYGETAGILYDQPHSAVRDIVWGAAAERYKRIIIGALWNGKQPEQPDRPWLPEEQAKAIRKRLPAEIPPEGLLEYGRGGFGYVREYYAN